MGNETETDKDFAFDNMTENQFGKDENAAPAEPDEEAETEIELPYPVKLSKEYTVGKKTFSELVFKYPITVRLIKLLRLFCKMASQLERCTAHRDGCV
jgi:hypothetical protein